MAEQKQTDVTADRREAEQPKAPETDSAEVHDTELDKVAGGIIIC